MTSWFKKSVGDLYFTSGFYFTRDGSGARVSVVWCDRGGTFYEGNARVEISARAELSGPLFALGEWTRELPTTEGFYFVRANLKAPRHVAWRDGEGNFWEGRRRMTVLSSDEFAGPLAVPEE